MLVGPRTFSGAEACAYDLQALKRATIVGEPTHGKGSAQAFVDGGATYVTVARCLLPGGVDIEGAGVAPDVEARGEDALGAAIAMLS